MQRFVVDRKQDNKREPLYEFYLIYLKFKFTKDKDIVRKKIKYKSKSGYCLDAVQKPNQSGFHTVSIEDIGKVQHRGTFWEIYCYEDLEDEGYSLMKEALLAFKNQAILGFINTINSLPV